ncbi:MAG TPA: helix-turn-helix transcriptional regulator [Longimicrobium sp.]|nr:helix-turn-helix transcriptional regulator [Longimicrobium sp.]
MTTDEVRAARERLGLSREQLAEEMDVPPETIRDWEEHTGAISRSDAGILAWLVALKEREEQLAAAGIAPCPWREEWAEREISFETAEAHVAAVKRHEKGCELCQARARYEKQLPPIPDPVGGESGIWRLLSHYLDAVDRLPAWARPAAHGAALAGGITLARAALLLLLAPSARRAGEALLVVAGAAALGSVGGFAYSAVHAPLRRLGRAGPYLTGIVVLLAYSLAFGVADLLLSKERMVDGAAGWAGLVIASILLGLPAGHYWFRETASPATRGDVRA